MTDDKLREVSPCPTCGKLDNPVCSDIYHQQREGHVYKDGVLQSSDVAQPVYDLAMAERFDEVCAKFGLTFEDDSDTYHGFVDAMVQAAIEAHPEDAPGGPLVEAATEMVTLADMDRIPAPNACVWFNAFDRRIAKLRNALNRLKGDSK